MVTPKQTGLAFLLAGGIGAGHVLLSGYEQIYPLSTPIAAISTFKDNFGSTHEFLDNPRRTINQNQLVRLYRKTNAACFPPLAIIPTVTPEQVRTAYLEASNRSEERNNYLLNLFELSLAYLGVGVGIFAGLLTNKFRRR